MTQSPENEDERVKIEELCVHFSLHIHGPEISDKFNTNHMYGPVFILFVF